MHSTDLPVWLGMPLLVLLLLLLQPAPLLTGVLAQLLLPVLLVLLLLAVC